MKNYAMLRRVVRSLVDVAYPELEEFAIKPEWGRTQAFASVTWEPKHKNISVQFNATVKDWPNAPLTGLIAHELSHPTLTDSTNSEKNTDLDVIRRGLSPYLAVERLYAEKYEDHVLRKGKDRYLGYRSIRSLMTDLEIAHLNVLLEDLSLIPSRYTKSQSRKTHDIIKIVHGSTLLLRVDGCDFLIENGNPSAQTTIIERDDRSIVMFNGTEVGTLSN